MFANQFAVGQTLSVDTNYTAEQLVQDFLIGQGIQAENVIYTGDSRARGYFNGSQSNIGLHAGIILATGLAADAEGPNNGSNTNEGTSFDLPGDSVLTTISGSPLGTFDAAILEFDFQSISDSVYLRYVFASNEYMFWVGNNINDAFALLISGPGIVGEENIAMIPGTVTPVSIENVNANVNSQYYIDNENPLGVSVEYNGFTQAFTAVARLSANQSYHARLIIADAADDKFDSAIFLLKQSFASTSIGLGVTQDSFKRTSLAYPNPTNGHLKIEFNNPKHSTFLVSISDALGRVVYEKHTDEQIIQLTTTTFSDGLYFYSLVNTSKQERAYGKFIVEHK
jgi:hypothetical protein